MIKVQSYQKNFLYLFTSNSVSQVVPFLLAPFIGRIFAPKELAVQENFLAIASLIAIVSAGRYEMAFVLPREQKQANNLFSLAFLIVLAFTLLAFFISLFPWEISRLYHDTELGKYLICLAPAVLLLGLNNILTQWMIRSGRFSMVSINRMIQTITQNIGYIALGYLGWGVKGLITSWIMGCLLALLPLILFASKTFDRSDTSISEMKSVAKEHRDFPLINSLHAFTDIFAGQFLLFFLITRNFGALFLGLFAIMNRYLRAPLNLVGSAVGQLYYKEASEAKNSSHPVIPVFDKSVKIVAVVTIPAIIVIFIFGPDMFALYLGEKWRQAGEFARIMAPAILFNFIASPVSSTPLIFQKQKQAYLLSICGYSVSLGLMFLGARSGFSFQSTLWVYSISLSVYYLVLFFWYRSLALKTNELAT